MVPWQFHSLQGLAPHRYEGTVATSDARGTVLPRSGVFWGVRAPRYHSAIISGELPGTAAAETQVRGWLEPHIYQSGQTSSAQFQPNHMGLVNLWLNLSSTSAEVHGEFSQNQPAGSWVQTTIPVVRDSDVAYAFVPYWADLTESPWRGLRRTLAPLRVVSEAILENIGDTLERNRGDSGQSRHVGLTAVAQLTKVLELSRPVVLRMGGVPESTFYAWQKSPQSIVRTASVVAC